MEETTILLHEGPHNIKGTGVITYCPPSCPKHLAWSGKKARVWYGYVKAGHVTGSYQMWQAECICGERPRYYSFGATLGAILEHLRRCRA